jgi:predicted RecA/RadA family phage recombinase
MAMNSPIQLERVRYWQGQLLASGDLELQMRVVAELRRLHNQAVHSAYGIAIGLSAGKLTEESLTLTCGLAYDCSGRELIIAEDTEVPLPSAAFTVPQLLTLAYNAATGSATLAWQPQRAPMAGDAVAVARLLPGAPPQLDPDFHPVIARPLARPQIAAGDTVPGDTAWETWEENGITIGLQSVVDTSAAGFTTTPNYFAEAVSDNPPDQFIPAWFTSIADAQPDRFTLRLFMHRITREAFEILDPKAQVANTPTLNGPVTLNSSNVFVQYDLASRLLPVGEIVSTVKDLTGATATLDLPLSPFTDPKQVAFGNPPRVATVSKVTDAGGGEIKVQVDQTDSFSTKDLVAKLLPGGGFSEPVQVQPTITKKNLTLKPPITGLNPNDVIGAADFRVRASVLNVSSHTITVANAALFPQNSFVARLDDTYTPTDSAKVTRSSGNTLDIDPAIPNLAADDILALCSFPVTVNVQSIDKSGTTLQVDPPNAIKSGDVVACAGRTGISIVANAAGTTVELAGSIDGIAVNDKLSVVTISGVVNVTPTTKDTEVTLAVDNRVRIGDFLADIKGWREPGPVSSTAWVWNVTGAKLQLSNPLDGLMIQDTVGLATLSRPGAAVLQLRLKTMPNITPGDEALLVGVDRLTGRTVSFFAIVEFSIAAKNLVWLLVEGNPEPFHVRPEDLTASVLFVRGSPLRLVRNQNLYVSWLACQNPDPMPRPCPEEETPSDGPCGSTKQP